MEDRWILALEDSEDDAQLLTREFMRLRLDEQLVVVADAEMGLGMLMRRVDPPCLIVADYRMPGMDGLEALREIRRMPWANDTPIIVVAASDEGHLAEEAVAAGADDFVVKPLDYADYRCFLQNVFGRRRAGPRRA